MNMNGATDIALHTAMNHYNNTLPERKIDVSELGDRGDDCSSNSDDDSNVEDSVVEDSDVEDSDVEHSNVKHFNVSEVEAEEIVVDVDVEEAEEAMVEEDDITIITSKGFSMFYQPTPVGKYEVMDDSITSSLSIIKLSEVGDLDSISNSPIIKPLKDKVAQFPITIDLTEASEADTDLGGHDLSKVKVDKLRVMATLAGIENAKSLKKPELVKMLEGK